MSSFYLWTFQIVNFPVNTEGILVNVLGIAQCFKTKIFNSSKPFTQVFYNILNEERNKNRELNTINPIYTMTV